MPDQKVSSFTCLVRKLNERPRMTRCACTIIALTLLTTTFADGAAAARSRRLFLFTTALPPGIDVEGSARRAATLADLRQIFIRDSRVVLTETPDDADVTVEVLASRFTRRSDDSFVET